MHIGWDSFYSLKHWGEYEDQWAETVTQALGRQRLFHMCFLRLPKDDNSPRKLSPSVSFLSTLQTFSPTIKPLQHLILSSASSPSVAGTTGHFTGWIVNGSESEQTKNRSLMRVQDWDHGACGPGRALVWGFKQMMMGFSGLLKHQQAHTHNSPARKAGRHSHTWYLEKLVTWYSSDFKCCWLTWDFSLAIWAKQNALGPDLTYSPLGLQSLG